MHPLPAWPSMLWARFSMREDRQFCSCFSLSQGFSWGRKTLCYNWAPRKAAQKYAESAHPPLSLDMPQPMLPKFLLLPRNHKGMLKPFFITIMDPQWAGTWLSDGRTLYGSWVTDSAMGVCACVHACPVFSAFQSACWEKTNPSMIWNLWGNTHLFQWEWDQFPWFIWW